MKLLLLLLRGAENARTENARLENAGTTKYGKLNVT